MVGGKGDCALSQSENCIVYQFGCVLLDVMYLKSLVASEHYVALQNLWLLFVLMLFINNS